MDKHPTAEWPNFTPPRWTNFAPPLTLRDEYGFTGKITVKDYICGVRQRRREMFVPLTHPPGHAQVDFGEALAVIGGVERKIHFRMSLPHSELVYREVWKFA